MFTKPVDFGFLDFSTLEKRRHYCHQEIKLNSRLSTGIYLEVLPVRFAGTHYSLIGETGDVVEYAVKMKRIEPELLMKSMFEQGEINENHLRKVAHILADFHRNAKRNDHIDKFGEPERFRVNTDENFEQVEKYIGRTIDSDAFKDLRVWTEHFYDEHRDLFLERINQKKIRDCHGDLHMEHVCFTEPPAIIDCIEFNDRFRYSDALADIAFLLMDLEYHGGTTLAQILWKHYKAESGDRQVENLLIFYKVYRAFVRGKVTGFQIDDENISPDKKKQAMKTASSYFRLARSYIT